MDIKVCYALCDTWFLPILSLLTFLWTVYQEYRHQKEHNGKKIA